MPDEPWPQKMKPYTTEPMLSAVVTGKASKHQRCARMRNHRISPGETIGFVPALGWCCALCAT